MAEDKWQILLLDDDPDYASSLMPFLQAKLGAVFWAKSENLAEQILERQKIDLLVLDIMLAHPDAGLRWCRNLKTSGRFTALPVFILSSVDERFGLGIKHKLSEPGYGWAGGFLDKATPPAEIAAHLEKFLRSGS